jgi:hypothetical protein
MDHFLLVVGATIIFFIILNNWLNGIIKRNSNEIAAKNMGGNVLQETKQIESKFELSNNEAYKNFLIVDTIRQLTDLAASQNLLTSPSDAPKYWNLFKERILNYHLSGKSPTLNEIELALEKELAPVYQNSAELIKQGVTENQALATAIVNWYDTVNTNGYFSTPELKANEIDIDGLHKIYFDFISGKYNAFSTEAKNVAVSDLLMIRNKVNDLINDGLTENEAVRCALENFIQNRK